MRIQSKKLPSHNPEHVHVHVHVHTQIHIPRLHNDAAPRDGDGDGPASAGRVIGRRLTASDRCILICINICACETTLKCTRALHTVVEFIRAQKRIPEVLKLGFRRVFQRKLDHTRPYTCMCMFNWFITRVTLCARYDEFECVLGCVELSR